MSKLIIDATNGTILNMNDCYIVDSELLGDDIMLSDSEAQEIANEHGISVAKMARDTGFGDNSYAYTVSYSPKSIHDECLMFLEGGIYDETDREWNAVKWVLETATQDQVENLSSWVVANDSVWNEYRSNLMEALMFVYSEETKEKE